MFFLSLAEETRRLPQRKRLRLQGQIMNLVSEAAEDHDLTSVRNA